MGFKSFFIKLKKSIELSNMLKIARHKDISVIFVSQNGAMITKDIRLRLVDCYLLRYPNFTQLYEEVPVVKKMYNECFQYFGTDDMKLRGFYISEIGEMATFDKPKFWNEELSKAYGEEKKEVNLSDLMHKITEANKKTTEQMKTIFGGKK